MYIYIYIYIYIHTYVYPCNYMICEHEFIHCSVEIPGDFTPGASQATWGGCCPEKRTT